MFNAATCRVRTRGHTSTPSRNCHRVNVCWAGGRASWRTRALCSLVVVPNPLPPSPHVPPHTCLVPQAKRTIAETLYSRSGCSFLEMGGDDASNAHTAPSPPIEASAMRPAVRQPHAPCRSPPKKSRATRQHPPGNAPLGQGVESGCLDDVCDTPQPLGFWRQLFRRPPLRTARSQVASSIGQGQVLLSRPMFPLLIYCLV